MAEREYRWRHLILLILLLVLYIAAPIVVALPFGIVMMNIMANAVFVAGVYAVSERRLFFIATAVLALCSVSLSWLVFAGGHARLAAAAQLSLGLMLSLFVVGILGYVLRHGPVTADKIYAAICVYLLIGYAWSFVFSLLEQLQPGSFTSVDETIAGHQFAARSLQMRYFSFVTLTTVGYGDIVPRSAAARSLVVIEAIMGQIYLAVVIARLVGLHIVHSISRTKGD